jgi:imidazolonepropionase-like amidohydrolase
MADTRDEMIKQVRRVAHAYGGEDAQAAILGGARTLEHGPLLTEDDLHLLGQSGTFWVPTLGTYYLQVRSALAYGMYTRAV